MCRKHIFYRFCIFSILVITNLQEIFVFNFRNKLKKNTHTCISGPSDNTFSREYVLSFKRDQKSKRATRTRRNGKIAQIVS